MIFAHTSIASLVATSYAIVLVIYLHGMVAATTLAAWLGAKFALVGVRIVVSRRFTRRAGDAPVWLAWGRGMLFADGLVWGMAAVFLAPPNDIGTAMLITAALAGVSTVAAFVLHADWPCCVAYTAPMQVPGLVVMLQRGDAFGHFGALSILLFYVLLLASTRRFGRQLEEMLTLRFTNEALTAQLSSALALAQLENRAKNEFVANMSHELRTPLHGILGMSSMLLGKAPTTTPNEGLAVIRRCGEHLLGLINNVLEFSRWGTQGIDLQPQQIDLVQLVEDSVEMCLPNAAEKGLTLSSTIALPRPFVVEMDPVRLRQIVLNLLGNALKFTGQGTVHVSVSQAPGGESLLIRVEDTGAGIAPAVLDRIFEPFVQGDSSNTRRHDGTGLGLSITRALCEAMGGAITSRSTLGVGSMFEVSLPLHRPRLSKLAGAVAAVPVAPAPSPAPGPLRGRVLLAEDNEVNAIVAATSLMQLGLEVARVTSGIGVVEQVCQTRVPRPDLVLLDCQMPEMDGLEAARRVREHEAQHGLRPLVLIALTANVFPEDREQCRAAGMNDFLAKPFNTDQLRELLSAHLAPPAAED